MQYRESGFEALDGLQLFEADWLPDGEPRGSVTIVHGYAEHCGRHAELAEFLVARGWAVYAFDLRGHGRSPGRRAFVRALEQCLDDLDCFLGHLVRRGAPRPMFLLGHSLGGAIAALYAARRQPELEGLVLSGPALAIRSDMRPLLQRVSGLVGRLLPTLPTIRLDPATLSRRAEVVEQYRRDPLVYHGRVPARTAAELVRATRLIRAEAERVLLPLLILHGTADRLADPAGSQELCARAASPDKTLELYEYLYHEVFNEPERGQVLSDLAAWLDSHHPSDKMNQPSQAETNQGS